MEEVESCNARFFVEEFVKLDGWSVEFKQGLVPKIKDLDNEFGKAQCRRAGRVIAG